MQISFCEVWLQFQSFQSWQVGVSLLGVKLCGILKMKIKPVRQIIDVHEILFKFKSTKDFNCYKLSRQGIDSWPHKKMGKLDLKPQ